MLDRKQKTIKVYKDEFGIKVPEDIDIMEVLGIKKLNLKQHTYTPYLEKEENYLQLKLRDYLLKYQKNKFSECTIISECIFQEYNNIYILISYAKTGNDKYYKNIIITTYDAKNNHLSSIKRALTPVGQKDGKFYYYKFKLSKNYIYEPLVEKFKEMGAFLNKNEFTGNSCQFYTQRFLPMIYFINNGINYTGNYQGHHIFYNTSVEEVTRNSILILNPKKHTKEFHPQNIFGSAHSTYNEAKGLLYSELLNIECFITKPHQYNNKIYYNIFNILQSYFIENKTVSQIVRDIENNNPKYKLTYNTVKKIIGHFIQYKAVLTPENINYISNMTK